MKKVMLFLLFVLLLGGALTVGAAAAEYDLLLGDVDRSNSVEAADARTILRVAVQLDTLDELGTFLADVDSNGHIDASDARMALRLSVQLEDITKFYHLHDMNVETVTGDCTQAQYTLYTCKGCGDTKMENFVQAGLHDWSAYVSTGDGKHTRTCAVCGKVATADCTLVEQTTPPTCTKSGRVTSDCEVCGWSMPVRTISPLGHNYNDELRDATCTAPGGTYWTCTRCDEYYIVGETPALGHDPQTTVLPVTCTQDGCTLVTCTRCDLSERSDVTPSPGHSYSRWAKNTAGIYTRTCSVCSDMQTATTEGILNWYNDKVNTIKDIGVFDQRVTVLSRTDSETITGDFRFGLWTPTVEPLLRSSFPAGVTTEYNAPIENRIVTYGLFPVMGKEYVSRITAGDVQNVSISENQTVNVLSGLPDTVSVTRNEVTTDYSLTKYKNVRIDDAVKLTVLLNNESATLAATGTETGTNTYVYRSGNRTLAADEETALERFEGVSLRDICVKFPHTASENLVGTTLTMRMNSDLVSTSARADWFFDTDTLAPIACRYEVNVHMDQEIHMEAGILLDGTMELSSNMTYTFIYLFDDYFPTS